MVEITLTSMVSFLIALLISTIIIYVVTKIMGEKEGFGRAILTAIIGTVIYVLAYYLIGNGLLAAVIAGFVWLLALKGLYKIGWIKALIIAVLIWVLAIVVGFFLPTLSGPL